MPKRNLPNPMRHRQHLTTTERAYDNMYGRKILHIDAWIYQLPDNTLYLAIETNAGGQQLITRHVLRIDHGNLTPASEPADMVARGIQRHVGTAWQRKYAPWLTAVHDNVVRYVAQLKQDNVRPGEFKGSSVKLWYVWSDPAVCDPFAGADNLYATTGYAVNHPVKASERASAPVTRADARSAWGARDRSVLRTLDKLLK